MPKKIIQDHPPVPSSINNTISPLFDAVVNKALSKSVETRYQSARDFGAALKRALEGKSEEDDSDKTVVGSMADLGSIAKPSTQMAGAKPEGTKGTTATGSQEVELEFWRAIKDGNDPDDFDLYVQQFPTGIYAALAKRKIAKLRGVAPEETGAKAKEQEKKELEEAAKREAEAKQKLEADKARLEAEKARKEAVVAAEQAKKEAAAAAEKVKKDAESLAKKQTEERAKREAEFKKREAELKAQAAAGGKKSSPVVPAIIGVVVLAVAGTGYWFLRPDDKAQRAQIEAMQRQLEEAKKKQGELQQAKKQEEQAPVPPRQPRAPQAQTRQSG